MVSVTVRPLSQVDGESHGVSAGFGGAGEDALDEQVAGRDRGVGVGDGEPGRSGRRWP